MFRARMVTNWELVGEHTSRPLPATLGIHCTVVDVTAQPGHEIPPSPNLVVVDVTAEAAELDEIAAHPACVELWREEIVDG